ncbi:MAG: YicC/YloC family endoribonuclease [Eubacteriales bacterium]|nr:YicC/YloC family endoribonuclease [Eubacteriales bacterium]
MIKSMTAYGCSKSVNTDKDISVEIKSVNGRYSDIQIRLPRAYLPLEDAIKSQIQNSISRGKIDVFITVTFHGSKQGKISLDKNAAKNYIDALHELRDEFGLTDDISVMTVAKNGDVFTYSEEDFDIDKEYAGLIPVIDEALARHSEMREAEGEKTRADMLEKMSVFRSYCAEVEEISKNSIVGYRDKFESRIRSLLSDRDIVIDENRILAECSIYADKVAIDEELARLSSHYDAFLDILDAKEPSGKKLDFLMQEFFRETNTIGSKANNAKIATLVVNMKSELEKIREQVQNVE